MKLQTTSNTWNKKKIRTCPFELAEEASSRSDCNKRKVGACLRIIKNGKDLSFFSGHNTHGKKSCECVPNKSDQNVEHAEISAIKELRNRSIYWRSVHNLELILYTTYQPCLNCSIEIHKKGISKVYFRDSKPEDTSGIDYLRKHKVKVLNKWN